jgi:hypothetical protein
MQPTKEQSAELKTQPEPEASKEHHPGSAMPKLPMDYDPIANAMARHPGLTRAEAEEMAEAFGF